MKFEEDRAFRRSHDSPPTETKEQEALKVEERSIDPQSSNQQEEQEDPSTKEANTTLGKKRPRRLQ